MRIWINYDLGLRGEYQKLYRWLDDAGAQECGDSAATLKTNKSAEQITKELNELLGKDARIYIITKNAKGFTGSFVHGKRQRAPWAGYGTKAVGGDTDDAE